jgi:drug/metabolite transporter (DMT)-like permease
MIAAGWMSGAFGLSSAAAWGAGDFFGGLATKRTGVYAVVIGSQLFGVAALIAVALVLGDGVPTTANLIWAAAAGLSGAVGLLALYRALAIGRMGLAAPVSGVLSAAIPVIIAARLEGFPGGFKVAGFAAAFAGIWLVARGDSARTGVRDLWLPTLAGCGFGAFIVIIARASGSAVLWPLVAARCASLVALFLFATATGDARFPATDRLGVVALSGLGDAAGNAFLVLAARTGRLDVAAVLSSLYPASTVLLARVVLHERVTAVQLAGLCAILSAIVMITLR